MNNYCPNCRMGACGAHKYIAKINMNKKIEKEIRDFKKEMLEALWFAIPNLRGKKFPNFMRGFEKSIQRIVKKSYAQGAKDHAEAVRLKRINLFGTRENQEEIYGYNKAIAEMGEKNEKFLNRLL